MASEAHLSQSVPLMNMFKEKQASRLEHTFLVTFVDTVYYSRGNSGTLTGVGARN
jgi:hypothetical protein